MLCYTIVSYAIFSFTKVRVPSSPLSRRWIRQFHFIILYDTRCSKGGGGIPTYVKEVELASPSRYNDILYCIVLYYTMVCYTNYIYIYIYIYVVLYYTMYVYLYTYTHTHTHLFFSLYIIYTPIFLYISLSI